MTTRACEICGAEDPQYMRWIDTSVVDFFHRTTTGFPGPTARAVHYCGAAGCAAAVEAEHGPAGNGAALRRLTDELGARGLDADENEVRLLALCVERDAAGAGPILTSPNSVIRLTGLD